MNPVFSVVLLETFAVLGMMRAEAAEPSPAAEAQSQTIAAFSLDMDPSWARQGQWAFGVPQGGGGGEHGWPDPTGGATGTNVLGVNLAGDYDAAVSGGPWYVTAGPFDFTAYERVTLQFQRWLNSDYRPYVGADIEVSDDGITWTPVWENSSGGEIADAEWVGCSHDISAYADGEEEVFVRWGYWVSRGAWAYSGWNLDDIVFTGYPADGFGVTPATGFESGGPQGGPFAPGSMFYALTNSGAASLDWALDHTASWLDVSSTGGTLASGGATSVTVTVNAVANGLSGGTYTDELVFSNLVSGAVQRRSATLTIEPVAVMPFAEDFEGGHPLAGYWEITGTGEYRTQVTTAYTPHGGLRHLTMDDSEDGSAYSRNELTLTIDLAGYENVVLTFWAKEFDDEPQGPPPLPFIGGADFDGVAISADGNTWYEVQSLRELTTAYQMLTVDLDAAAAAHGLAYNSRFKIRFNHYDDYGIATDGFAFDDVQIVGAPEVWVSPTSFRVTNTVGGVQTRVLTIGNAAGADGNLDFTLSTREGGHGLLARAAAGVGLPPAGRDFSRVPAGAAYKPGRLLVRFAPEVAGARRREGILAGALAGATLEREYRLVPGLCRVTLDNTTTMAQALVTLNGMAGVLYAEPDYEVKAIGIPNDAWFGDLWGMHNTGQTGGTPDADIDAPEAWDAATGGTGVVVAVIDTGVDYSHEDLAANMWVNAGEVAGNGQDDDGNGYVDDVHGYDFVNGDGDPMDDNAHGTHCSGTIGGVGNNSVGVAGVCWQVRIMAMKFLDASGYGDTSEAISCIEYAVQMGAKVLSNSWGSYTYEQSLKDAIDAAGAAGIVFVAAAGNDGEDTDVSPHYPSSYDSANVIAVMATDDNDQRVDESGWWASNYGQTSVDLGAPGLYILSSVPGSDYDIFSGTSMAAPHVAGACGLLLSRNAVLTPAQMKSALLSSVDTPTPPLVCVSGGRLNLAAALAEVGAAWLTLDPESGTGIPPGGSTGVAVRFEAGELAAGSYTGDVQIACNDPLTPQTSVVCVMLILPDDLHIAPAAGFESGGPQGGPFAPGSMFYALTNSGVASLDWALDQTVSWLDVSSTGGTLVSGGATSVTVTVNAVANGLSGGTYPDELVFSNLVSGGVQRRGVRLKAIPPHPDYFTELFAAGDNDLDYALLTFIPDGSISYYAGYCSPIAGFPTDPTGGTPLSLSDDDYELVFLPGGAQVKLYGVAYDRLYVGGNGYITFGAGDTDFSESLADHFSFDLPRISALFDDLAPPSGGAVSWKQLADRVAVTFADVPDWSSGLLNNFQFEMFSDGTIRIAYLNVGTTDGLAGLSRGTGVPGDFVESDLSAYPRTPAATNPQPADLATGVSPETLLTWTPWQPLTSQNVYFGTTPSLGAGQRLGNYSASTASVDPGTLSWSTTYYWRVDGLNAGGVVVAKGPVWQFTTSPPMGSLQFKSASYPVNENGVARKVYVSRTGGSYGAASVGYATANGTATAGLDYTAASGTLNWADGDTADKYATITILDDSTYESSETFTVVLSGASGASLGSPATTTVTIADNDLGPARNPSPAHNATGVSPETLLGWTPGQPISSQNVYFGTTPSLGAGQLLGNYSASVASVDPGTLSLATTYYWRVDGLDAGGAVVLQGPLWQFTTDASRGSVQFKSATYLVNENGLNCRVYVSRTGGSYGAASVGYATANGSAAAGSDYTAVSGTFNWADGDSADKSVAVTIVDDSTYEGSETFTVSVSGASGASLGSPATTTVTIADNDPGPATNPSPAHNATGVSPETLLGWTPGQSINSQNVYFGTTPSLGAGQLLGSYSASTASVDPGTLSPGTVYYWRVDGHDAGGVVVSQGAVWQFTTEALRGSLQFKSATYPVNENGVTRKVYVSRTGGSYGAASVNYATANGTATAGSDYTAASGALNWGNGDSADKYATITILDDSTGEDGETFTVALSGASGASLGSPGSTTVTIADNDPPPAQHNLTVSASAGGSVTQPGQGVFLYDHGATVPIAASAGAYCHFSGWGGTAAQAGKVANAAQPSTTVTVDADYTISAGFAENLAAMGTPQWWLAAHGLSAPWDAAELSDQDHDGMAAWQEWRSDTDPMARTSVLRITGIESSVGSVKVHWQGGVGAWQYLESKRNLPATAEQWTTVFTNVPPTSVTNWLVDPSGANRALFYRIRAERQ